MGSYPPHYAYPSAPPMVRVAPNPPRLHWGLVVVLTVITLGYFSSVWLIVQSNWVRKVLGRSKTLPWAIVYACILPGFFLFAFGAGIYGGVMHVANIVEIVELITKFVQVAMFAMWLVTTFMLRSELEAEPIGIPLGGGMTFFFGPIYFQYHLFDYEVPDALHQHRGPLRPELPEGLGPKV